MHKISHLVEAWLHIYLKIPERERSDKDTQHENQTIQLK